ncbi:MAG TPA: response regulator transcription factor [Dehalococcoidia bacterium]|nr:response regulator transcription factor [Dehalococcoidia bacterium]
MEKSKVFLSDPQVLFREGIHFILSGEDDFEVIGETTNNEDAYTHITANPPNIAVLSMHNGKYDGPEITCRIKRSLPSVAIILIMEKANNDLLFSAIKSGASACLTKNSDPEYLLDIIRVVSQGSQPILESLLIPEIASRILIEFEDMSLLSKQLDDLLATLAPQESKILNSIASGNTIEQIATELDMTEENIRRNLRLILNKLVANDQSRTLFEAAQRNMPVMMQNLARSQAATGDYITREEFNEFKESLMERLKSLIGELT